MQIDLNAAPRATVELHIVVGCRGLIFGLLHDALGDEAHPYVKVVA